MSSSDGASSHWIQAMARWLPAVFSGLQKRVFDLSRGERGVLMLSISTELMEEMLNGKARNVQPDHAWYPADQFVAQLRAVGYEDATIDRWEQRLALMDPMRDVALFLTSPDDAVLRSIVTHDGNITIQ